MQVQDNLEQILSASRNRRQHRRQPAAAAAAPPANDSSILADLLLKATDKRNLELDTGVLRRIKALCRKSEEHIGAVHDYLLHALEANHAQVRLHAMEICDQLFQRSHLFRHLTTQHLPQILEHAVGTKASRPLPGPPHVANRLHEKALESIDQWADKYGAYYQQLRVTMRYLKDVLQMQFPQLRARALAAEAEARAREARAQDTLREKLVTIVETYDETSREIQSTLAQMEEAFELLMPKPDQAQRGKQGLAAQDEDDLEWEDVAGDAADGDEADEEDVEGLSEYRDAAVPEGLLGRMSVVQNPDPAVLETLGELNQLLGGSHMRTVNEWLRILTQVVTGESGSNEDREREQLLRRATELRGSITRAQDRYGAVMDAFKTAEEITLGMPPKQHTDASATTQQGPKEAVPPWLARQQPNLADLFGGSSSDEEQPSRQANSSAAGEAAEHSPSTARLVAGSLQAIRKGAVADSAAGATQPDVSAAGIGLRMRIPQAEVPDAAARGPVPEGYNDEEEGNTPKYGAEGTDPWDAVVSDADAEKATPGASSEDSDRPQPNSAAATRRGADRRQNGHNSARADSSASQETKKSSIPESLKQALAAQAPVVPSGPHLAYWDSKDQALVNARGMQVYNHWGPVDEHKTLPTERLNELFGSMASYYKPPSKQELQAAGKRKAEQERPRFTDEPLEAQRQKRPRAPVTPILPPAIAKLIGTSTSTSQLQASSHAAASVEPAAGAERAASPPAADPEQVSSAEQPDQSAQRSAYLWPSHAPLGRSHKAGTEGASPGFLPDGKAAAEQEIEVDELEWKPEEAAGPSAGDTQEVVPAQLDERREASPPPPQARAGRARDPEKPSKGQRALDKAYNDAVLAEAAAKDPILAHRWAAQQTSKAEKTKKAQGAKKKLGVRASLARKLLSKRAVMSAAHDMSTHEAEAHQDLNTNRWEEK